MASISPGIAFNNLTRSVQERYSVNVRHLPKKNIESVFRSVTEERYTMPPLVLSQDKTMLLDRKSPLSANDYRVLFNVTSTKRQLFGLARKLHLLGYKDLTKVDLVEQIKEKLSVTGICEPVELIQKRKSTKPVSVIPNNVPFNNKNNNVVFNKNNKNYNFETPKNNNNINFGTRKNNNNFNFGTPKNNNNNRSPSSVNISSVGTSTNQATIPVETGVKSPNVSTTSSAPRTIFTSSSRAAAPVSVGSVTRTIRKRPINTINDYNNFNNGLDTSQRGGFFSRIFSGTGRTKKSKKQDVETFMKKQNSPQKTNNTKPRQNSSKKNNNTNNNSTANKLRRLYTLEDEDDIQKIATYYDNLYSKAPNSQIPMSLYRTHPGGIRGLIERNPLTFYSVYALTKNYVTTNDQILLKMMKQLIYNEYIKYFNDMKQKRGLKGNTSQLLESMYKFVKNDVFIKIDPTSAQFFFRLVHMKNANNAANKQQAQANKQQAQANKQQANKQPGLKTIKVVGDGSCLFRSVALGQSLLKTGTSLSNNIQKEKAETLRLRVSRILCEEAQNNSRKKFGKILTNAIVSEYGGWESYCQEIKKPNFYGGEVELMILPHIIERPIRVYRSPTGVGSSPYGSEFSRGGEVEPVRLLFTRGETEKQNHYDLLVIKDKNSNSINTIIRQRIPNVIKNSGNTLNKNKINLINRQGINQTTVKRLREKANYTGGNNYSRLDAAIKELFRKEN